MDLPSCPACKQSVLDDDVDECPFCGASMSGKPVAAKAAPKPTTVKTESAETVPSTEAKPQAKSETESTPSDEDDPFELEKKAEVKAVPLHKKPEPGRSHKVMCPMCETPGYTARKVAGMQVRCANSECMVPVFTAPHLEEQSTSQSVEKATKGSKTLWIGVASVVVLGGAFGLWYFVFGGGEEKVKPASKLAKINPQKQPVIPKKQSKDKSEKKKPNEIESGSSISREELEKLTLEQLKKASNHRNNIDRPVRRETTAVVFASSGQLDEARNQIRKLENIAPNFPYFRVLPWLEIGWWHLKQNSSTAKEESLAAWKKAEESFRNVRSKGALRFELTAARAALLYALGQKERGGKLVEGFAPFSDVELVAVRKLALEKLKLFDRERHRKRTFFSREGDLTGVAVALELVSHGREDLAFEWSLERAIKTGKGDALLVWVDGEMFNSSGVSITPSELQAKIQKLGPAIETVVFAHIAAFHRDRSQEFLRLAEAEFAKFPPPESIELKTVGDVSSASLSRKKWIPYAVAAFQLAIARSTIAPDDGAANASSAIEKGVDYLRSVTPGVAIVRELQSQERTDKAKIRQEIVKEYRLTDNTAIDIQIREYRRTLQSMNKNASRRFRQQIAMLSWVSINADASLLEKIWNTLLSNRTEEELNRSEPYFETPLPWLLIALLESKGKGEKAKSFEAELSDLKISKSNDTDLTTAVVKESMKLNTTTLADAISSHGDSLLQLDCSLIVAARLVKSGKPKLAVEFAKRIDEGSLRRDVLQCVGGLCIASGQWDQVTELTGRGALPPAEMSALCRGIFWGLQAVE